mgnify:FL=1
MKDVRATIEYLIQEARAKVPITVDKTIIDFAVYEPRFSDFRRFIVFDSTETLFRLNGPFLDELEQQKRRFTNQLDTERPDLVGKGFFVKVYSDYRADPFGLLTIEHNALKISRKFNDYRFNEYKNVYREYAYFLFDEAQNKYVQCKTDEINKVAYLMRTHSFREIEVMNKFEELTLEFYRRKERTHELMTVIQDEYEAMRDRLHNLLQSERQNFNLSSDKVFLYLKDVENFLRHDYKALAGCYLLSKRISESEYVFHLNKLREASERFSELNEFLVQNKKAIFELFDEDVVKEFGDKMMYFRKLFAYRKATSTEESDGYFVDELKRENAFRTLVQIDVEHIFSVESDSHYKQIEMREHLIKRYASDVSN